MGARPAAARDRCVWRRARGLRCRSTTTAPSIRGGYGIFLNQWAYSVQTAFARNLPFFFTRQVDVPSDERVPTFQTRDILTSDPTGAVSPTIMDHDYAVEYTQTWSGGLQYELAAVDDGRSQRTWGRGRSAPTTPRSATCRSPGRDRSRRAGRSRSLEPIEAIRFDGKSIYHAATFKAERRLRDNYAYNVSYTLSHLERRCIESGRDGIGSQRAAERAKHLRRHRRVGALELRPSAPVRRERRPTSCRSSAARTRCSRALLGGWRVNAVFLAQSGAPFTVNLGVDQANIGAGPAQRPDQLRDPNLPSASERLSAGSIPSAFALPAPVHLRQRAAQQRDRAWLREPRSRRWRRRGLLPAARELEFRWEIFNLFNTGELRPAEPHLRHAELRPHLQREESARDAVRREIEFLRFAGSRVRHYPVRSGSQRSPRVMIRSSSRS